VIAIVFLAASLLVAVIRPRGVSEALVALPAAGVVVALGIVPWHDASRTLREMGPTVGFLAAILVFGHLCAEAGVFDYLGARAAALAHGRPSRLLTMMVVLAAAVTAVLTLDATVVLLTPIVLAVATRAGASARPFAYACVRLANSGSLLLPVSNLTNLLAFSATGLSFGRFAALMALPWLVACAGEWLALRTRFAAQLAGRPYAPRAPCPAAPRYALAVVVVTVLAMVSLSSADVAVAWAALGGCVLLLVPRFARRDVRPLALVKEASPGFCAFVLALAVLVDAVVRHGLGDALTDLVPSGTSLPALLGLVLLAAAAANLVNNLPATLALVPIVAGSPAAVLAVLIGVNVGPNATYGGSLATLLWRRMLPERDRPAAREFHLFGLWSVPLVLLGCTVALWISARVVPSG